MTVTEQNSQQARNGLQDCEPFCDDEWSKLREVIVGRAEHSCFPPEPPHMISRVCPPGHESSFKRGSPFPAKIVDAAVRELDNFASVLESYGVTVHRPTLHNWQATGGYTSSMARDGLMVIGKNVIESCYAWRCRLDEISLSSGGILEKLALEGYNVIRAPHHDKHTLYDGITEDSEWAINDSRPAFDCADFMRFGKNVFGQLSNVTNPSGIEYVRRNLPEGYTLHLPNMKNSHAMHIDATLTPITEGFAIFDDRYLTEAELRRYPPFNIQGEGKWKLYPCSLLQIKPRNDPPLFMTSPYIVINLLTLDKRRVFVEEKEELLAEVLEAEAGMEVIKLPFRNVNSLGGSFHCATVDIRREKSGN